MKKINYCIFIALLLMAFLNSPKLKAQVLYETMSSGLWNDVNTWRSWPSGQVGVGTGTTPTVNTPSGANKVLIHSGHTIKMGAGRSCRSLTVEAGGKLWADSPAAIRLQVCTGGTGYPYPINDTIKIDGTLGGPGDGLLIEPGTNAANVFITGSGSIDLLRMRMPGGLAGNAANGGVLNMVIDANINLYQNNNYALSAVYNPASSDNYSMTINPGKTVRLMDTSGYWHNNQYGTNLVFGNYTYNILGTLDLSMNNQTRSLKKFSASLLAPQGINSHLTLNIDGGIVKTGRVFIADTSVNTPFSLVSTGILKLIMKNGGQLDASAAQNVVIGYTSDGAGGYLPLVWGIGNRAYIQQTVADSLVVFPIAAGNAVAGNNLTLINAGTPDLFTVSIQDTFDHTPDAPLQVVNRQWTIGEAVPGGSNVTAAFSWVAADEAPGVSHAANAYFNTMHWNGSSWEYFPAIVTGSGTINDPYTATTTGISSFSPFGLVNNFPVIVPVLFTTLKARYINGAVQIDFVNATEINVHHYEVQRSYDGKNFTGCISIAANGNTGSSSAYQCSDPAVLSSRVFYRIKATDNRGKISYSMIVQVGPPGSKTAVIVYPTPVSGNQLNISLQNYAAGEYTMRITNLQGQVIHSEKINHPGGTASRVYIIPSALQKGIYQLQVSNGSEAVSKSILIQ